LPFNCRKVCELHARQKGETKTGTAVCMVCTIRLNKSGMIHDAGQIRCICCNSLLRVKTRKYGKTKIELSQGQSVKPLERGKIVA